MFFFLLGPAPQKFANLCVDYAYEPVLTTTGSSYSL